MARIPHPRRDRTHRRNPLHEAGITYIDYKDTALLRRFISDRGKIRTRRVTGLEDVDLDEEDVRLPDGTRLTEQRAGQLARETLAEIRRRNLVPGRKSLSGGSVHSPRVQFRVPEAIRERAEQRAAAEGKSLSALAREALEHYLEAS